MKIGLPGKSAIELRQRTNELKNHAHRPVIRGISVQRPVLRLVAGWRLIAAYGFTAFLAAIGPAGAAGTFNTLYDFQGGSDGNGPNGGLIFDASGALYGTAANGGGTGPILGGQVI